MNDKSIFKKLVCPKCRKWTSDETGKAAAECASCGVKMKLSDKWHVRLTRNGVTTVKAISSRRQEAVDYLHAAKDATRRGQLLPGEENNISWEDAKAETKKWIDSANLASGTRENYHGQLKHLDKFFSEDLQEITVKKVEEYRDERMELVASKTVAEEIKFLKRIYALHCRWNSARTAPTLHAVAADLAGVEMPKYNNKRTRFLSEPEVELLFKKCTVPHLTLAIQIALSTGLRLRNITNLEWKQIDFINRTITYEPPTDNAADKKNSMKSKRMHVSPVMEHLVIAIKNWRVSQKKISPFVFPSPTVAGQAMDNMRTTWENLLDECNKDLAKRKQPLMDDVVFHTLRHTFASHFLMNGGDLVTLSELLDHASIQITKDRYGHLSGEHKRKAIDSFSGVFFKSEANR